MEPPDHAGGAEDAKAGRGSTEATDGESWLTAGVLSVGAASFFSDSGHEIATSLLPSFLTSVLHGSAGALGIIEGLRGACMGIMKVLAGRWANDGARRRRLARADTGCGVGLERDLGVGPWWL